MRRSDKTEQGRPIASHPSPHTRRLLKRPRRVFMVLPAAPTRRIGDDASVRHRCVNRAEHLADHGIPAILCTTDDLAVAELSTGDAVIFNHPVVTPALRRILDATLASGATVVADIDSHHIDIGLVMRGAAARMALHAREQMLADLSARAEALRLFPRVLVPDEDLATRIRRLHPHGRIDIVRDVPIASELALARTVRGLPGGVEPEDCVACLGPSADMEEILPTLAARLLSVLGAAGRTMLVQTDVAVPPALHQSGRIRPVLPVDPLEQLPLLRTCRAVAFLTAEVDIAGVAAWRAFAQAALAGVPFVSLRIPVLPAVMGVRLVDNHEQWLAALAGHPGSGWPNPPLVQANMLRNLQVKEAVRELLTALT